MKQLLTKGIVLSRTDYCEADRIITLLTPDQGKLSLMAKGVRRIKSKLAGGIELFSVSDVTYIKGRGDVGTLVSSRLDQHYGNIIKDLDRTMLGYDLIKQLNKFTEDHPDSDYFNLLHAAFEALNDTTISTDIIRLWFSAQLLRFNGHTPNLQTDVTGQKLDATQNYNFSFEAMAFVVHQAGAFSATEIKFLRILFSATIPSILQSITGLPRLVKISAPLVKTLFQ